MGKRKKEEWDIIIKEYCKPIVISDKCQIRSSLFHNNNDIMYDVVIEPRMVFGTGYHTTTELMIELLLKKNIKDNNVLDNGCGSGILSIIASKMGAKSVIALDIDEKAIDNTEYNCEMNDVKNVTTIVGSIENIKLDNKFDVILSNINKETVFKQITFYKDLLLEDGVLIISGIREEDETDILSEFNRYGMTRKFSYKKEGWLVFKFVRKS